METCLYLNLYRGSARSVLIFNFLKSVDLLSSKDYLYVYIITDEWVLPDIIYTFCRSLLRPTGTAYYVVVCMHALMYDVFDSTDSL